MTTTVVVWSNPVVYINGVDFSAQFTRFKLNLDYEELNPTAINDTGKRRVTGLQDNMAEGQMMVSWASSQIAQTVKPLLGGTVAIMCWPNGSTTGTANPKYTGNFLIKSWPAMDVNPGQIAMADINWACDGTVAIAYT